MTEERFTPPSLFCPKPEYWHSPDSEATETEITRLVSALIRAIQPEFVLETGSYLGHTSLEIALALRENGHGHLVTIEKDQTVCEEGKRHVYGFYQNLPITMLNMNTMDYVPEQDIDFAFFDSWQEGRALEFLRFHELGFIKKGAIVSFHDTAPHHQVMNYVQRDLVDTGYIVPITIHSPRGFTIAQVIK